MPAATIGESFRSFFDAVGEFTSNLASVRLGPLLLACVFFVVYLTFRARASFNILRAAYPDERFRFLYIWGAYFAGYGFNAVVPARGGDVVRLFLTRSAVPGSSYPAVAASFFVEAGFDLAMGSLILAVRVLPGRVPQAPGLREAERLRPLLPRPAPALRALPAHGGRRWGRWWRSALLSARMRAFWDRVKQGFTILRDRRRYFREVFAVQLAGWVFRFAAFWMLLEAFRVGGSVKNVLLVLGVNAVAAAVPFTPQGAGVAQALLVKVFAGTAGRVHRGGVLGGPADRDRGAHVRDRLRGAGVHLPRAELQGGDPPGPRGRARREARRTRGGRVRGRGRGGPRPMRRAPQRGRA